jgi:hypothetical protein
MSSLLWLILKSLKAETLSFMFFLQSATMPSQVLYRNIQLMHYKCEWIEAKEILLYSQKRNTLDIRKLWSKYLPKASSDVNSQWYVINTVEDLNARISCFLLVLQSSIPVLSPTFWVYLSKSSLHFATVHQMEYLCLSSREQR